MFTTYDFYTFVNTVYWGSMLVLILIGWGILKANKARMRFYVAWFVIVSAGFIAMILPSPKKYQAAKEQQERYKERYKQAEAVFKKQCEQAGEKIYRTVDNVEGIMLLKIVPKSNYSSADAQARDPMWDNAALQTSEGENFIARFLGVFDENEYKYIDVLDNNQKNIIRYMGNRRPLTKNLNPKNPARYAVTFEYNLDPELRKHWVAGATIHIIDRQTKQIIAEKVTYAFETGLGSTAGARMPWAFAITCENKDVSKGMVARFVTQVLKPRNIKQEIQNVK